MRQWAVRLWDFPTRSNRSGAWLMLSVRMDGKGRLVVPREVREALDLAPGDVFFVELEPESGGFRVAKAPNPFDVMADYAVRESAAGRTIELRALMAEEGYAVNDDGSVSGGAAPGGAEGSR